MNFNLLNKHLLTLIVLFECFNLFPQEFVEQTDINLTGVYWGSVAWGDYDSDGDLDLLIAGFSYQLPDLRIYRNNGDNSFTEQSDIDLPGIARGSAVWGDYDGDNDLDLLLTGQISGLYFDSKVFRNNGNNSFSEQSEIVLSGADCSSGTWGDFDNDGDLDILLTGTSNTGVIAKIYRNNDKNRFAELAGLELTGVDFSSLECADYDNDGYLDILLAGKNSFGETVSIIYRNDGDLGFIEQSNIVLPGISGGSVDWGDYNNDGYMDILLTGEISSNDFASKVFHNNGNNSFTDQTTITLPGISYGSSAWGDYDCDGYLDILLTGWEGFWGVPLSKVYRNNGDNSFSEQKAIALSKVGQSSVAWGDYDNDTDLDIILTGNDTSNLPISKIFRNETSYSNSRPSTPSGLQSYWEDDEIVFKWRKSSDNNTPGAALSYNMRIGTESGRNDVKASHALPNGNLLLPKIPNLINDTCIRFRIPVGEYYWTVQAIDQGVFAGTFALEQTTAIDSIQAKDLKAIIVGNNSLLVRWQNGNGFQRALFGRLSSSGGLAEPIDGIVYRAEPDFSQGDEIESTGWYCMYNGKADSAIVHGLVQGGSYDFQVLEYIVKDGMPYYFNVTGSANPGVFSSSLFSEQTAISIKVDGSNSVAWGDYNNDGFLDVLLPGSGIYRNNGDNSFTKQTDIVFTQLGDAYGLWGDYNNDGFLDIVLTGHDTSYEPTSIVYRNNGDNSFSEQTTIELPGVSLSCIDWGDYDNDGDLDLLISGAIDDWPDYPCISKVFRNNGKNGFEEQTGIELESLTNVSAAWGDSDNDGDLDILLTGATLGFGKGPSSKLYLNNGNNDFIDQSEIQFTDVCSGSLMWGDYDNDEDLDILLTGDSGTDNIPISKIYRNNGNNEFGEQTMIDLPGVISGSVVWGDYDNDGDLDIILTGNTKTESSAFYRISKVYRNDGNNIFTEQEDISLPGAAASSISFGDYDNDGDSDLLFSGLVNLVKICKIYRNNSIMRAGDFSSNNKPPAPKNLSASSNPKGLELSWDHVKNDETGYKSMTYNVRLSTTPNGANICPSHSDLANGFRQIVGMGNTQLGSTYFIADLLPGRYYWSVQAVDQGFQGGDWGEEQSFEFEAIRVGFEVEDTICPNESAVFSNITAGEGLDFEWDFGDGTFSNVAEPVHSYPQPGEYEVKLTASNDTLSYNGLKIITVLSVPSVDYEADEVCIGLFTTLSNTTNDNGLLISSWYWDFDDGLTSDKMEPQPHGFINPGTYNVQLSAVAENGCSDTISKVVSVLSKPEKDLTTEGLPCIDPDYVLKTTDAPSYLYQWKYKGIDLSDANGPTYNPDRPGEYAVVVSSPCGEVSASYSVEEPVLSIIAEGIPCEGSNYILRTQDEVSYSYQWKYHGTDIPGAINYSHYPAKPGDYSVVVQTPCGEYSSSYNVGFLVGPPKPEIFVRGPEVWYLACSNDSAAIYQWYKDDELMPEAHGPVYVANRQLGVYRVRISDGSECYTISDPVKIPQSLTGLPEDPFSGLRIYPNPSPGVFNIEMDNAIFGDLLIDIFSGRGSKVLGLKFLKETSHFIAQVDLSGQGDGSYVIRLQVGEYETERKIVINN